MGRQFGAQGSIGISTGGGFAVVSRSGSDGGKLTVKDEGTDVSTDVTTLNFIGADVRALLASAGVVSVYIPSPAFDSHWNTSDGDNGNQSVTESITRTTARISTPTSEGNPFKTGGTANTDAPATNSSTVTFTTPGITTGWGGDSTMTVTMFDADGTTVLETYTTPSITGNGTNTSGTGRIVVTISSYAANVTRFSAKASVEVKVGDIFTANSLEGGRYNC